MSWAFPGVRGDEGSKEASVATVRQRSGCHEAIDRSQFGCSRARWRHTPSQVIEDNTDQRKGSLPSEYDGNT